MGRILLVEDDRLYRFAVTETLRRAGYEVLEAENGERARALFGARIDLVLFDCHLPDADGLSLLEEMVSSGYSCRAIVMTAEPTEDGRARARASGAYHYVEKTGNPEDVVALVRSTLGGESPFLL